MKRSIWFCFVLIIYIIFANECFANAVKEAETLIRKSQTASIKEEGYEYLNKARIILEEEFQKEPTNKRVLVGLSKVNQLTGDRSQAKLYILKAYNLNPADPKLQKEMGDFFFSFDEYSTAIEYYKLALASGLLKDYETNLQTAKCFERLGDNENAELYYKITGYVNPKSKAAKNKINEYESTHHPDETQKLENAKYKYLFKDKKLNEEEQNISDTDKIIESLNGNI